MATISMTPITTKNSAVVARGWFDMSQGDVGERFAFSQYADKTVHIHGDFGTGATVTLRGSNLPDPDVENPDHWLPLTDAQANAITKTAPALEVVLESPLWVSPIVAGTPATANIAVLLSGKETN